MSEKRDYYEVLGVAQDAETSVIKKTFRKLAMKFHPDRFVGKSAEETKVAEGKFQEINEAHDVLKDDERRTVYDQFGFEGLENYESGGNNAAPRKDYNWDDISKFDFGGEETDSWSDLGGKKKTSEEDGLTPAEKRKAKRDARRAAKENGEEAPKTERQSGFNKTSSAKKEAPKASTARQQVDCVVVPVDTLISAVAALKEAGQDSLAVSLQSSLSSGRKTKSFRPK